MAEESLETPSRRQSWLDGQPVQLKVKTRERTPDMAVQNFDGGFDTVHAREVRTRICSRPVVNFIIMAVIVIGTLGACLIMLAIRGFEAPGSEWLKTIAAFCVGVFLPQPKVKKADG